MHTLLRLLLEFKKKSNPLSDNHSELMIITQQQNWLTHHYLLFQNSQWSENESERINQRHLVLVSCIVIFTIDSFAGIDINQSKYSESF